MSLGAIVVGTGFGVLTHLRALRAAGFEVHALVGRDPQKTKDRAALMGVPHGLTSLDEALALPGVDAVTVATPPHTHLDIVLAAVAAGKHILCEKPFAANAADGQRMLDAAQKAGVVHLLGTEFRYSTAQALATRAIREGKIGKPRLATLMLHMPALADPSGEVPGWWTDESQGGGWLGAYGSHIIDQVRDMMGEIEGVSASLMLASDRDWTAEDTYTIHFRTRTGAEGVLQSSSGSWGGALGATRIVGSKGTLWIEGADVHVGTANGVETLPVPEDLVLPPPDPPPAELLVTAYDMLHSMGIDLGPYTLLCEVFRDLIEGKPMPEDPRPATFVDAVACQAVLDAARLSSREKRWVAIDA